MVNVSFVLPARRLHAKVIQFLNSLTEFKDLGKMSPGNTLHEIISQYINLRSKSNSNCSVIQRHSNRRGSGIIPEGISE